MRFLFVFFVLVIVVLELCVNGEGDDSCFFEKKVKNDRSYFYFEDCKNTEMEIKWKNDGYLYIDVAALVNKRTKLFVHIGDNCTLKFRAYHRYRDHWVLGIGQVLDPNGEFNLRLAPNGTLGTYPNEQLVGCMNTKLFDTLNDGWLKSKFRIEVPNRIQRTRMVIYPKYHGEAQYINTTAAADQDVDH
ncbi:hypothetical protein M3Y94_01032300 [Aphelenchoides besseyi]|nr:hypothetical protein M3Y94_01032300 [Aphelenchoides besseyi]KAI6223919.1 hypothetical protein M3Y95_00827700 [Aphelenchoides besseyi]